LILITDGSFLEAYVDDYKKGFAFYAGVLGLKKVFDFGPEACFFKVGKKKWGLYLSGGNAKLRKSHKHCQCSFALTVKSASKAMSTFRRKKVKVVQKAPVHMGKGTYWFQVMDPATNVISILGGK
jgi:predicted enzyme related to lactoylglutathione lyase